jgi:hypothetical protein
MPDLDDVLHFSDTDFGRHIHWGMIDFAAILKIGVASFLDIYSRNPNKAEAFLSSGLTDLISRIQPKMEGSEESAKRECFVTDVPLYEMMESLGIHRTPEQENTLRLGRDVRNFQQVAGAMSRGGWFSDGEVWYSVAFNPYTGLEPIIPSDEEDVQRSFAFMRDIVNDVFESEITFVNRLGLLFPYTRDAFVRSFNRPSF